MTYSRPVRRLWILILGVGILMGQAWAGGRSRVSPGKSKKGQVAARPSSRRPAVSRGKAKTTRKSRTATKRRRARRYAQTWTTSPFADSTEGDRAEGEDAAVRAAARAALGPLNGSVVVVNPNTGRILTMVNQKVALGNGYSPCSTIKLPVALAALNEGIITKDTPVRLGRRWSLTLADALARSNNPYFETLGRRMGFETVSRYAREFGFGELAGYHIEGEQLGAFPEHPPHNGVGRMCSFGEAISVTPLQLAAFVSAIANGGTLYYLQYRRGQAEIDGFQPRVKRHLNIQDLLPSVREGMMAAVAYGTARHLEDPYDQVLGKTGTCSEGGTRLGWFASYENAIDPQLAVVVLLRGGRHTVGPRAAEVAGRLYRMLHESKYYAQRETHPAPRVNAATAVIAR